MTSPVIRAADYLRALRDGTLSHLGREAKPETIEVSEPVEGVSGSEAAIQSEIVDYLRRLGFMVFHIPNGGKRRRIEAAVLLRMGVLAGAPDLVVVLDRGRTVWIEVKAPDGRVSADQKVFAERLGALGHAYHVVRSAADVVGLVRQWSEAA